ncbi:flagellar protein FliS [Peptoanaerobacter stomatis]|uniref:Flagellar protein FliS n=1 Tax=Peptoanaerobacter stomatis TaxID=796937 RepID=G9XAU6_9FIRM|nr:flagellar export chaperone FliS [Peptoanaerobacter stomatis]EHL19940.1 flagellar protein FliS [Peptoanaerobacter stomatis]
MLSNPYAKYKENSINTASKEELTLMLYDGCIKFMNLAKIAIEEKNIQKANDNLLKAQAIVTELDITLNMDIEISKNLHSLYDFVQNRLIEANLTKKASFVDEAKLIITDLRDAWKEAINLVRRGK